MLNKADFELPQPPSPYHPFPRIAYDLVYRDVRFYPKVGHISPQLGQIHNFFQITCQYILARQKCSDWLQMGQIRELFEIRSEF